MFWYRAYGLSIVSDLEFPELCRCAAGTPDVTISHGHIETPLLDSDDIRCVSTLEHTTMFYPGVALLRAVGGRTLHYSDLGGPEDHLRLFILGCGLAMICEQRERLTLHAAAVVKDGRAMLLCGNRGAGKSTTTAALLARGWQLLSDDVTALDGPMAAPALPYLRLWPPSLELLGLRQEDHPRLLADGEKRRVALAPDQLARTSAPVAAVMVLDAGDSPQATKITSAAAVMTLVTHSFNAAWGQEGFTSAMAETNFTLCSQLARSVPMWQVKRPMGQAYLPAFLDLLEELVGQ